MESGHDEKGPRTTNGGAAGLLTFGGIATAFGVACCCGIPILLATFGLSAAWLGGIGAGAAPYREILLVLSALCLIGGAVLLWRQQRAAANCPPGGTCTPPAIRIMTLLGLVLGAFLLWLGYFYA